MKKNILFAVCVLCVALGTQAQKINYGLTFGGNLSMVNGRGIEGSYNVGYVAGGFARIPFAGKWELQPEVLFNFVNLKRADDFLELYNINGYANSSQAIKLSYITVPLLVGYHINKTFIVNVGPQYSFLADDNENLIQNNKVAFKRSSVAASAGLQINLQGVRFFADYVQGINNINNIDNRYKWHLNQMYAGFHINI